MLEFVEKIHALPVPEGHVGVIFIGQAGFILKSSTGELLAVDPYLSNCCERYFGFKRLMPMLLLPGEIEFDYVVASHGHYDHFDVDSIPMLLSNGKTHLLTAADGVPECRRLGIPEEFYTVICKEEKYHAGAFCIQTVDCDHGELAPDALGLYITCGEKHLYFAGDTCYRRDIAEKMSKLPVDFAAAPINGAFGNMDGKEAADFLQIVKPKLCVPCHYWNFAQHMGDPNAFIQQMDAQDVVKYLLMCPGEAIVI